MGISLGSFHVFGRPQEAVAAALRFGRFTPSWVSPRTGQWVSFFPAVAESEDHAVLNRIGTTLSKTLATVVWGVMLQDSMVLLYTIFKQGRIAGEYDSFPELAGPRTKRYRELTNGKPRLMIDLCPSPVDLSVMKQVLYRKPLAEAIREVMAEEKTSSEDELMELFPEDYVQGRIMEKRGYSVEEERLADIAELLDVPNALLSFRILDGYLIGHKQGLIGREDEFIRVAR